MRISKKIAKIRYCGNRTHAVPGIDQTFYHCTSHASCTCIHIVLASTYKFSLFDRGCQSIRAGCAGGEPGGGATRARSRTERRAEPPCGGHAGGEPPPRRRRRAGAERRPRTHAPTPTPQRGWSQPSVGGSRDAPVAVVAPETNTARYCESVITLRL
jgi:hypothetical protein